MQVEAFLYKPDGTMDVAKLRRQLGQHLEDLSSLLAQELLQDDAHADGALSDGEREDLYQAPRPVAGREGRHAAVLVAAEDGFGRDERVRQHRAHAGTPAVVAISAGALLRLRRLITRSDVLQVLMLYVSTHGTAAQVAL